VFLQVIKIGRLRIGFPPDRNGKPSLIARHCGLQLHDAASLPLVWRFACKVG
jgi:hypothetical protein